MKDPRLYYIQSQINNAVQTMSGNDYNYEINLYCYVNRSMQGNPTAAGAPTAETLGRISVVLDGSAVLRGYAPIIDRYPR